MYVTVTGTKVRHSRVGGWIRRQTRVVPGPVVGVLEDSERHT